ncbi:nucleotidyltransferase domain-containing protein [Conexibacter sp. JD483]|uniref:nucleotidyltransferase domain-containing protein n=1 Tax=unclassified Conexibacter TaxID=2627773 RepID=UPI00271E9502|nr:MULTISPECIES: nucleotidyltransferase domain-containing protein [unclassified Conexibacter]MDO8184759.1 nucleotidyltransferase domain-containing protein [Conexibacter sp. CPCC 205706]MDO8196534.1 nucleotidyltransferase domain-containing protein [Conexibacter sp. CPCC 205762]MDR9369020.1 nucleotidyltransferase domain-containing protein [Conexibacter sp. JD483]
MVVDPGELAYLDGHWDLLAGLTGAFRTEPNVSLAVLYGSAARGDDRASSDIDLLVSFRDDVDASSSSLARRLERRLRRPVDVARYSRVRREAPFLLLQAVDEGRVLVDRDDTWASLRAARETIARASRRRQASSRAQARAALDLLGGEE